jgi:hypothetical protein
MQDTTDPMPTAKVPEPPLPAEPANTAAVGGAVPPSTSPPKSSNESPEKATTTFAQGIAPAPSPPPVTSASTAPEKPIDEVEALMARFNALKKH